KTALFEPLLRDRVGPLLLCAGEGRPEATRLLSDHGHGVRAGRFNRSQGIDCSKGRSRQVGFQSQRRSHDDQEDAGRRSVALLTWKTPPARLPKGLRRLEGRFYQRGKFLFKTGTGVGHTRNIPVLSATRKLCAQIPIGSLSALCCNVPKGSFQSFHKSLILRAV